MKIIDKKILPQFYNEVVTCSKTFEIRKDEDNAEVGDILLLREWDGKEYTGRLCKRKISYILRSAEEYGLMSGYCIYGLQVADRWISTYEDLPDDLVPVNIVWINRELAGRYPDIKDEPQTATGLLYKGKWYWYSIYTVNMLSDRGVYEEAQMHEATEVLAWRFIPKYFDF